MAAHLRPARDEHEDEGEAWPWRRRHERPCHRELEETRRTRRHEPSVFEESPLLDSFVGAVVAALGSLGQPRTFSFLLLFSLLPDII